MPSSPSFRYRSRFELVLTASHRAVVSLPAMDLDPGDLKSKALLPRGHVPDDGKFTLEQHLDWLSSHGRIDPGRPFLALGLRNTAVNARCIMVQGSEVVAADNEIPQESARPYLGLGLREGRWAAGTAFGDSRETWDLFVSGVPVLWDGVTDETLYDLILVEAADHSHVFDLPRGNHPQATAETRRMWSDLHETFLAHRTSPHQSAAEAMRRAVARFNLARSDNYLHSVLGVDDQGRLVNVVAHGRLEALGRMAADLGCRHAICVENSGSVMPTLVHRNDDQWRPTPLLRAPNHRPKGRALLVLELEDESFGVLEPARHGDPVDREIAAEPAIPQPV